MLRLNNSNFLASWKLIYGVKVSVKAWRKEKSGQENCVLEKLFASVLVLF